MGKHVDRATYDTIVQLLTRGEMSHQEIADRVYMSRETVRNVWTGKLTRPKETVVLPINAELKCVAAMQYDRIMAARKANPRATYQEIADQLGVGFYMVSEVLSGRAKRGIPRGEVEPTPDAGKCRVCGRSGPKPCVYCAAKREAAKRKRRYEPDCPGTIEYELPLEMEERRREMWRQHVRMRADEPRNTTPIEDAA